MSAPYESLDDISGNLGGIPSHFSPADFQDAEDTRPPAGASESFGGGGQAVREIVGQTMSRHLAELVPIQSPAQTGGISNWRKRIREIMVQQNETALSFLLRPVSDHPLFGPVETAMRRFAMRGDTAARGTVLLKTLLNTEQHSQEIQGSIASRLHEHGPSNLPELQAQNRALLEYYKETGEKLIEAENQLKLRLEKMDKLANRIGLMMELQTNEAIPALLESLEQYLKIAFKEFQIEEQYKQVLALYQKHAALRDAIKILQVGTSSSGDPMCGICLAEPVCYAHAPCGHTFCGGCSRRQGLSCPICRTTTRERIKLFFS
jgi:hypothetical protein